MPTDEPTGTSRRDLLKLIGLTAGSAAMYQAMTSLGYAAESGYKGPIKLDGDPKGASVLILGAGLAGMVAALELRQAGYKVKVLEYNNRAGGRNWSLRGGDSYTELGGATQKCEFDAGLYLNPGPWRIPYHHHGLLDYCKRLGVALEPFMQLNHNAYLHSAKAFGGKPQRIREIKADFQGHVAELLAKATQKGQLDELVSTRGPRDAARGAALVGRARQGLRATRRDRSRPSSAAMRSDPGGGLGAEPVPGEVDRPQRHPAIAAVARPRRASRLYEFQTTMFQPVGGMGRIGEAFAREVGDLITYNAKVTGIRQDEKGVTVTYEDTAHPGTTQEASADWCVCTIPLSILSQIPIKVGAPMQAAIAAVPYASSVKIGLQFKRRFWEEDEQIFGGISYTDLPIRQISYPSTDYNTTGKGVLLGGYTWNGANSFEFTAMTPQERIERALDQGTQIHPQYRREFENGISVAWHRSPFTLGCAGDWTDEARKQHYDNLCQIDGRIVLAGEHASYIPAWQEGAILSSLDAIGRLHKRVLQG